METTHQANILAAMTHPRFYPHPVETIQRQETHISTVFLTGPFVYKVKKPVDLGFLNFANLNDRRHYCQQEIVLNRRLSQGVYIGVVPITAQQNGYVLNGSGPPVEYAVKMRQLAQSDAMVQGLQDGTLDDADIHALGRRLVHFYTHASTDPEIKSSGGYAWKQNLKEVEPFAGKWLDRRQFTFVQCAAHAFYRTHKHLFHRRRQQGMIRDCHGDLRTDHIYFTTHGIQIIDCIEFNRRLRNLDIICDLAFLAMDMAYQGYPQWAWTLIRMVVEQTDDIGALPLLNFYRCYRAMVRCKVSCLCYREKKDETLLADGRGYLDVAHAYADTFSRPILWVVCGLPASGKSTLAKQLAAHLDIDVIRSDVIRKRLFADSNNSFSDTGFGQGLYSPGATEATYKHLFSLAKEDLKTGNSVVIDATFSKMRQRSEILRIAAHRQATPVFVECVAAEPILVDRLRRREATPSVSDARLMHLPAFKKRFEPMARMKHEIHIRVDTQHPPADCLREILLTEALWDGATRKGERHV